MNVVADALEVSREQVREFDLKRLPADFIDDPFPYYRALREHDPVHRMPDGAYLITRWRDCDTVYRDARVFSSDKKVEFRPKYGDSPLFEHHTTSLVFNDPPLHTHVRRAIQMALSNRVIAGMEAGLVALVDRLLDAMAATGLTAGNAMDFDGRSDELITSLAAETTLSLRLRFAPMCMPGSTRDFYDHIIDLQHLRGARWQVEGVKFMIDGTIDGGTAWLEHPDSHGESAAPFWPDPLEYPEAVRYLAAAGVPTVTHAIGDAGVKYVLDALSSIPSARTNKVYSFSYQSAAKCDQAR